jgi:hypothetical protein
MKLTNQSIPNTKQINFEQPAIYSIQVSGFLDKSWSDRLGGLEILCCEPEGSDGPQVTILTGELIDQAALLGVLNALYNWRYPLLSVERLGDIS